MFKTPNLLSKFMSSSTSFNKSFPNKDAPGAPPKLEFLSDPATKRVLHPLVNTSTDLEFGVEEVLPNAEIPEHFHENNEEILFIYKGTGLGYIEGQSEKQLTVGDTMYVPRNTKHRLRNLSNSESLWIAYAVSPPGLQKAVYINK